MPCLTNDDAKFASRAITLLGPVQESPKCQRNEIKGIGKHSTNIRTGSTRYFSKWDGLSHKYNIREDAEAVDMVAKDRYHQMLN